MDYFGKTKLIRFNILIIIELLNSNLLIKLPLNLNRIRFIKIMIELGWDRL